MLSSFVSFIPSAAWLWPLRCCSALPLPSFLPSSLPFLLPPISKSNQPTKKMATCSSLFNHAHISTGCSSLVYKKHKFTIHVRTNCPSRQSPRSLCCFAGNAAELSGSPFNDFGVARNTTLNVPLPHTSGDASRFIPRLMLADIDPATAQLAIGVLGPFLSAFSFLFILRIVMSWYPKLPVGKFPYVLAYAPTEPLLVPTRKLIPPLAGVDVTPVVWFGLLSFLNEILVGPQGLLVLISQQVN